MKTRILCSSGYSLTKAILKSNYGHLPKWYNLLRAGGIQCQKLSFCVTMLQRVLSLYLRALITVSNTFWIQSHPMQQKQTIQCQSKPRGRCTIGIGIRGIRGNTLYILQDQNNGIFFRKDIDIQTICWAIMLFHACHCTHGLRLQSSLRPDLFYRHVFCRI